MNSRPVTSSQTGLHSELETVVRKHLNHSFQKPIGQPTQEVFEEILPFLQSLDRPLVLDSGCGTGESTERLGLLHPDAFVLGIDKSDHRLTKRAWLLRPNDVRNHLVIRADLIDFWRLLASSDIRPWKHYHLYPNPWPKPGHLQRRWHGHAVFPTLVQLGGEVEMRSNWDLYLREFAQAWEWATGVTGVVESFTPDVPLTPFERKYHKSQHTLYRLCLPVHNNG